MRVLRALVCLFALVGAVLTVYLGVELALDARNLDRTRGGYEPPYTGYTGEPLRLEEVAVTTAGGVVRGRVLDSLIACETGGWRFELLGFGFDYRGCPSARWSSISRRRYAVSTASTPRRGIGGTERDG